jgi:nitroreductase
VQFADVVRARRMVRAYHPGRAVPDAVLDRLLQHAVRAPSAGFSQGWDFVVLRRPEDVARFWTATTDPAEEPDDWLRGLQTAPVLVVCLADPERYLRRYAEPDKGWDEAGDRDARLAHWPVPYWDVDTGMAALLMLLTAVDAGLGACFFGVPGDVVDAVREAFGIPSQFKPVGAITIGHPSTGGAAGSPTRRGRKPQDEVVHHGRWGA